MYFLNSLFTERSSKHFNFHKFLDVHHTKNLYEQYEVERCLISLLTQVKMEKKENAMAACTLFLPKPSSGRLMAGVLLHALVK